MPNAEDLVLGVPAAPSVFRKDTGNIHRVCIIEKTSEAALSTSYGSKCCVRQNLNPIVSCLLLCISLLFYCLAHSVFHTFALWKVRIRCVCLINNTLTCLNGRGVPFADSFTDWYTPIWREKSTLSIINNGRDEKHLTHNL